jgi:hypothetical protein
MARQPRKPITPRGRTPRTRNAPSQAHREPPQRGTTRSGGHSAYAAYPHEQFAAGRAAEAARTRVGQRVHK